MRLKIISLIPLLFADVFAISNQEEVHNKLSLHVENNYKKEIRPNAGGKPVTVGITIYVLMAKVSENDAGFETTLDMYFRQFWYDPRLSFAQRHDVIKMVYGPEMISKLWTPDTFIVNAVESLKPVRDDNSFLRIVYNGDILLSQKISPTIRCPTDYSSFPMDSQTCTFEIESFGFTMSDVKYRWNEGLNSVQLGYDLSTKNFQVIGHRQRLVEATLSSGNYSRLIVDVYYKRYTHPYKLKFFLPVGVLVISSWLSFLLNLDQHVNARVCLTVGPTILMAMLQILAAQELQTLYWKALDYYIFGSLLIVLSTTLLTFINISLSGFIGKKESLSKFKIVLSIVDYSCLILIPLVFFLFNIKFWSTYSEDPLSQKEDIIHLG